MVNDLKYLKKGGRITTAGALIANVMNLKPVLQIQGDKLDAYAKCRGIKSAKETMIAAMHRDFDERFKEYVDKNLADSELSVETIAADLGLSRVQLYRKIKALTGCTPVDLLRKARLSLGKEMLKDCTKSVSEVAYACGFTSPAYFTKCFKDEYGVAPGDGRK